MSPAAPAAARGPWWRDWGALLVAAGAGYVALYLAWLVAPWTAQAHIDAASDFASLPVGLLAFALVLRTGLVRALDPRLRRAWLVLAAAFGVFWCADAYWMWHDQPDVSLADVGYVAFYPLAMWGLMLFPTERPSASARAQFRLDAAVVLLGGAMVVWYYVLGPLVQAADATPLEALVAVSYPVGDVVLFFGCLAVVLRRPVGGSRVALAAVAGGLTLYLVADLVYSALSIEDRFRNGGIADVLWIVGYLAVAVGAHVQRRHAVQGRPPADTAPTPRLLGVLPYASVATGYAMLLADAGASWSERTGGLTVGAVLLTLLVMLRQAHALRENGRLLLEAEARRSEVRFRSLVQHASDLVTLLDADGVVRFASPAAQRVVGRAADALVGGRFDALLHEEDVEAVAQQLADLRARPASTARLEFRLRHADGRTLQAESVATNLLDEPEVRAVVLSTRDVSERTALEARLAFQAFHDSLTRLANRALFIDRVTHALGRARRSGSRTAVLFLDLDEFKQVNDTQGHARGDELLVAVAGRLLSATRGSDTVARLGGDEFAVLLEGVSGEGDVGIVAERIRRSLAAPLRVGSTEVTIGASVGIAFAGEGEECDELLRNADLAMYRAKNAGGNRHEFFRPEMYEELRDRLTLEEELKHALERDELRLVYQPIMDLGTLRIAGVEALLRWQHPTRGLVSPADFIPVAESTGLIVPIGRWVLRQACRQAAAWHAAAPGGEAPVTLTVNISGRQLVDPALPQDVADVLRETRLDPHHLVLEITESVAMADNAQNLARLHALKALGVRLAIDDFGTGYSSLSYLQQFPIDVLKIDKAFVDGVARGRNDAALARTIVALGETLSLRTVAEGIETREQHARLAEFGCSLGQGYLFARPLGADAVGAMLASGAPITETVVERLTAV